MLVILIGGAEWLSPDHRKHLTLYPCSFVAVTNEDNESSLPV